ncbi:caspase family protein [Rhodobacteraceae bacterium D3-12]|nr:caspase family protein [Rhodobacteraceae bacterium D3-12]
MERALGLLRMFGATVLLGLFATQAQAQTHERLAVVIGNQDYKEVVDLDNARNDAVKMAAKLRELGFTVFDAYDVDRRGFETLLRQSILNVGDGAEIVFFYAGHGVQIGRRNYLLPVDVSFDSIYDLPVESVTLDRVIELLSARGEVHIAIIDACRDNPFPNVKLAGNLDASLFEAKSGFEVFRTPLNSLVAFSTSPGMVAFDGEGDNSPYTTAILDVLNSAPSDPAQSVFSKVREAVYQSTKGKQVPWESSTLVKPFQFGDANGGPRGLMLAQATVPKANAGEPRQSEPAVAPVVPVVPVDTPVVLPKAISLTADFNRRIELGPLLAQALKLSDAFQVTLATAPKNGTVSSSDKGGLAFVPVISEQRAAGYEQVNKARFVLDVSVGDVSSAVDVSLTMPVNKCDLAAGDALDSGSVGYYRLPNEIEVLPALEYCRTAAAQNPDLPRYRYQLGRAELAAGRFEAAMTSFQDATDAGYVRAKHGIARLLSSEQIDRDFVKVPYDLVRANALFEEGIAAGDPFAIHSRGLMLLRNGETKAERERGFELLDRSAELGHTYSMNELGVFFLSKSSNYFLPERGMEYLRASAARDDIYGYHNLGFVALFGLETGSKDFQEAFKWFKKGADGGHPKSPAAIGRMIVQEQLPGKTKDEALRWYDLGLERGDGWGGANGAFLITNGEVGGEEIYQGLIRAAKTVHLPDDDAAAAAQKILDGATKRDLSKATQALLNELGASLAVDGAIGPATRKVLNARAAEHGLPDSGTDATAQLLTVAKVYWAERPTRPDLY